jgi:hypothetical protein
LPREVFFFGFGFAGRSFPAAAARAFCFFVATLPSGSGCYHRTWSPPRLQWRRFSRNAALASS